MAIIIKIIGSQGILILINPNSAKNHANEKISTITANVGKFLCAINNKG